MAIGGIQGVQKGQVTALTRIETGDLLLRTATVRVDELRPAIAVARQQLHSAEGRLSAAFIQPGEELLEMHVDGERFGFVEQLQARTEFADEDAAPLAMGIAHSSSYLNEGTRVLLWRKGSTHIGPVSAEMREQLLSIIGPMLDSDDQLTRQHGIFFQQGQDLLLLTELAHEVGKARFRRLSRKLMLQAGDMHFQHKCFGEESKHLFGQGGKKSLDDVLWVKWQGVVLLAELLDGV